MVTNRDHINKKATQIQQSKYIINYLIWVITRMKYGPRTIKKIGISISF